LGEFSKNRQTADGLAYYSKPCNREKQRQWKESNPVLADKYRGRVRKGGGNELTIPGTKPNVDLPDNAGNLERDDFAVYTLTEKLERDPANLGFPAMLPVEIALKTAPLKDIFEAYGLTREDYDRLKEDPVFLLAVKKAAEMAKKEGFSFRMKALMQAEELLRLLRTLIHSADTPPQVKKKT